MSAEQTSWKRLTIPQSKQEEWDNALSDFLCWIEGFKSGGGKYSPGSEGSIRDLRDTVNRAYQTIPPTKEANL